MKQIITVFLGLFMMAGFLQAQSGVVEFNIIQINDVYEISPLEGGKIGGMARVATLRKTMRKANKQTVTILAGDFVNPSAMGEAKIQARGMEKVERLKGRQMVDIMNRTKVDWVCFGNHEFDLKEAQQASRIEESKFDWISSNVRKVNTVGGGTDTVTYSKKGEDFPEYAIWEFKGKGGVRTKVGVLGLCMDKNNPDYAAFENLEASAGRLLKGLKGKVDFVIALTHQSMWEDQALAKKYPEIKMILGGHEHRRMSDTVRGVPIYKADANAKSAWVHTFRYTPAQKELKTMSKLLDMNTEIKLDKKVQKKVKYWEEEVFSGYRKAGFEPKEVVAKVNDPLDGRETSIRFKPTNMGRLIAESMKANAPGAEFAITNSGSVRIDDELQGEVTQYDVIRVLPFGGSTVRVTMPGELLRKVLDKGLSEQIKGNGGYLQTMGVDKDGSGWIINGDPLDPKRNYEVAMGDYLATRSSNYIELWNEYKDQMVIHKPTGTLDGDVRLGLIDYMKKKYR